MGSKILGWPTSSFLSNVFWLFWTTLPILNLDVTNWCSLNKFANVFRSYLSLSTLVWCIAYRFDISFCTKPATISCYNCCWIAIGSPSHLNLKNPIMWHITVFSLLELFYTFCFHILYLQGQQNLIGYHRYGCYCLAKVIC